MTVRPRERSPGSRRRTSVDLRDDRCPSVPTKYAACLVVNHHPERWSMIAVIFRTVRGGAPPRPRRAVCSETLPMVPSDRLWPTLARGQRSLQPQAAHGAKDRPDPPPVDASPQCVRLSSPRCPLAPPGQGHAARGLPCVIVPPLGSLRWEPFHSRLRTPGC